MTSEKSFANEMMSSEQLDNISGGTVEQFTDIWNALGVDSNISIGWLGTGFRENGNAYNKGGNSLTHQQVLDIINAA